jgi:predicted HAD superfamily Cof-like phosphohydrolase
MYNDIKRFHERFELNYDGPPRELDGRTAAFRIKFMQEELDEYTHSCETRDLEGQFDALIDLVYVVLGTAYLQGFPFDEGWGEVQNCNMMKVRAGPNGEGSKRGSPLDVIKPAGWVGPDLKPSLRMAALIAAARRQNDMFEPC